MNSATVLMTSHNTLQLHSLKDELTPTMAAIAVGSYTHAVVDATRQANISTADIKHVSFVPMAGGVGCVAKVAYQCSVSESVAKAAAEQLQHAIDCGTFQFETGMRGQYAGGAAVTGPVVQCSRF
jgi:hypothetical protein